jgi:hypothetical protein
MTFELTYSTVRLTLRRNKIVLATGTGFIYRRTQQHYIVTAWHNLSGRHSFTLEPLQKGGALPDNMIVDMPSVFYHPDFKSPMFTRIPVRFEFDDGSLTTYRVHSQGWPRVDVAAIPFDPEAPLLQELHLSTGESFETRRPLAFQQEGGFRVSIVALSDDRISPPLPPNLGSLDRIVHTVGDDLFLLGFPAGVMDSSVIPIWKRATIATEPDILWKGQKQLLVDSASRRGMSGGPALYFNKDGWVPVEPGSSLSLGVPVHILHGVYVGRIGDSEFEAQVGVVWKNETIDEVIDFGRAAISTQQIECSVAEVEQKIREEWPQGADPNWYLDEKPALGYLTQRIMEKLAGRSNPYFVAAKLKEVAAEKMASMAISK